MNAATGVGLASLIVFGCAGPGASLSASKEGAGSIQASATRPLLTDRAALVADLEATRDAFLASVNGLSEAQVRWKAGPDRWSIAEVAEHIAVAEQGILGNIQGKVMKAELTPELREKVLRDDGRVHAVLDNRSQKRQAPERLRPTGRFPTLAATVGAFSAGRARTLDYARTTPDDLRAHAAEHPALGVIDGHQWLLFLSAHSARHTAQIREVQDSPGFPR